MADVKWIKIVTDIFDDEKMLLIESLPSADSIIVIWFKLLCLAGKNNNSGVFLLNERIPYTEEMLATIFRRDLNTVRLALKTFSDFGMIELFNNVVTIPNWNKHQTLDSYEKKKERDRLYQAERRKKQKLLLNPKESSDNKTTQSFDVVVSDIDIEEDKDIDIEVIDKIINSWNSLGLNKLISIKNKRYKALKQRINEFTLDKIFEAIENINKSSFLKGENDRNWSITFDWLMKPNNFIKVLEGNYLDRDKTSNLKFVQGASEENRYNKKMSDLEKKLLGWD